MAEMISSGDFSLAPLEAGILLDHPVEAQSINRRKIGKKSGYLPPFFFPWVSSLFLVISALTPWSKSWMLSSYNTIFSHVPQSWEGAVSSVSQSCLILCNPMDCSSPGFPVHHQPLELAQTHVHRVGDAIQLSHPLSSPSPPYFNLAHHQDLF